MTYCPNCVSFREECNPEPEDYNKPCSYFKEVLYHSEAQVTFRQVSPEPNLNLKERFTNFIWRIIVDTNEIQDRIDLQHKQEDPRNERIS